MDLRDFFEENKKLAVALSGGVDSAYLLAEAMRCGTNVKAYYVKSQFQPAFEREDARRIASQLGAEIKELELDVLADSLVAANPADRCYHCKQYIMGAITEAAKADGYDIICDGTNASDNADDRPGFAALKEFGVRSPLRECGLSKDEIRLRARDLGLDVWDKPAYACLATRIACGERITEEKLRITEKAEARLHDMGFRDFRVRMRGSDALVQIRACQHEDALGRKAEIEKALGDLYNDVMIDEETR